MSQDNHDQVDVFIPVKNEAAKIEACLKGILSQTVPVGKIIAVDSGSSDDTLEKLRACPKVEVVEIPPAEFNHGTTRNLGPLFSNAGFLVYTVGDARPLDEHWLSRLLEPVRRNPRVAAVCGTQVVPHEKDKNPLEWFRPVSQPEIREQHYETAAAFDALPPEEKRRVCAWDDVTALYRRTALVEIPFQKTLYCEDGLWAMEALRAGMTLAWNPAARVYHYHLEDAAFTFKRTITVLYHRYRMFGLIPTLPQVLRETLMGAARLMKMKGLSPGERVHWMRYHARNQAAMKRGTRAFLKALHQGPEAMEALHVQHCGRPPIPLKHPGPQQNPSGHAP